MALPESSSEDNQGKKSTDQDDKDFDPSPEALIDEIDDERTLEEEEAMGSANGANVQEELDALKKESEMPIEELLAYYQQMRESQGSDEEQDEEEDDDDDEEEEEEENEDEDEEKDDNFKDDSNKDSDEKRDQGSRGQGDRSNSQNPPSTNKNSHHSPKTSNTGSQNLSGHRVYGASKRNGAISDTTSLSATDVRDLDTSKCLEDHQPQSNSDNIESQSSESPPDSGLHEPSDSNPDSRIRHSMTEFVIDDDPTCMFKTLLGYDLDESDDLDEDYSCSDDDNCEDERDWRRVIHIGPEHQADIPEGLSEYDDLPPYQNDDKLVWKCNPTISQERLIEYLKQASALSKRNHVSISPASVPKISNDSMRLYRERIQSVNAHPTSLKPEHNHENNIITENVNNDLHDVYMSQSRKRARIDHEIEQANVNDCMGQALREGGQSRLLNNRDENSDSVSQDARPDSSQEEYFQMEEQLLYLLLQCNYNFDEAIRRRKLDPNKYYLYEPMSLWSQEECLGFEHGLRTFGKNFRLIREDQVQTRTHAEVVGFYYLWKKSERHDVYTNQYRLDRKRSLSHPGTTDYMDKFIEDNESSIMNASSPSSPMQIDGLNRPKIKEYLVDINNSNQDRVPGFLKTHTITERPPNRPGDSNQNIVSDMLTNENVKVDLVDNSK